MGRSGSGQENRMRATSPSSSPGQQHAASRSGRMPPKIPTVSRAPGWMRRPSIDDVGPPAVGLDIGGPIRPIPPVFVHLADPSGQLVAEEDQGAIVRGHDPRQRSPVVLVGEQPFAPRRRRRSTSRGGSGGASPFLTALLTSASQISRSPWTPRGGEIACRRSSKSESSSCSSKPMRSVIASRPATYPTMASRHCPAK